MLRERGDGSCLEFKEEKVLAKNPLLPDGTDAIMELEILEGSGIR